MDLTADVLIIGVVLVGGVAQGIVMKFDLFPRLKVPLDGRRTFRGHRVFGENKTWRGALVMIGALTIAGGLAFAASPVLETEPPGGWAALGFAMGLGYIGAELPNSFAKRQLGVEEGGLIGGRGRHVQSFLDLADSVIGAVVVLLIFGLAAADAVVLLVLGIGAHWGFDVLLHRTGAKPAVTPRRATPTGRHR